MNKVPQITVLFWVIKILSTGMGESASDWALRRGQGLPGIGIAGTLGLDALIFVVALVLQFSRRRYVPPVYWFAVVGVSIFGTVAADVVHFIMGVPLWATTAAYAGALALDFGLWYRLENTLSIHSINTRRRETFYWIAVFFTLRAADKDFVRYISGYTTKWIGISASSLHGPELLPLRGH